MSTQPTFAGRYRLRALLGEGGFKSVYRAHDLVLGRDVALATFRFHRQRPAAAAGILREARALARLGDNPRIVTVFDAGECDGVPYLVTRLMTGGDLTALLATMPARRLPPVRAVAVALDVLEALETVHAERVVHRDVTPANIWLDKDGRAVLGDFGVAAGGAAGGSAEELAEAIGKLPYMAPEVLEGQPASPASDLYSLGCTLYELLTGRPPFVGESRSVAEEQTAAAPAPPSERSAGIPPALDQVVMRLLAKRPEYRPDAAAARAALRGTALDSWQPPVALTPAPPAALPGPTQALTIAGRRRSRQGRGWLLGSVALIAALLLTGAVLVGRRWAAGEDGAHVQSVATPTATPAATAPTAPAPPAPSSNPPADALQTAQVAQAIRDTVERGHTIWAEAVGKGGTASRLSEVYADGRLTAATATVKELRAAGEYEVHERLSLEYVSVTWTAADEGRAETLEAWSVTRYGRAGRVLEAGTSRERTVYTLRRGSAGWRIVNGSSEAIDAPAAWYTVVVDALAAADGAARADAERAATLLRLRGFPAEVLLSSDYPRSFRAGYWVVCSGRFSTRDAAASSLVRVQRAGYPGAVVREVGP